MKKKSSLSGLMAAAIAALGIAVLPACGDDAADKAAADKAASKPPVQQTTAAKEDKDPLAESREQFINVTKAAGSLRQQVELCFFDLGTLENGRNPDTGATECSSSGPGKGYGWNLVKAVADTLTFNGQPSKYVASASVNKGVITLTSRGISVNGKDSFNLILVPALIKEDNRDVISWKIDPASTCLSAGLCEDKKPGM